MMANNLSSSLSISPISQPAEKIISPNTINYSSTHYSATILKDFVSHQNMTSFMITNYDSQPMYCGIKTALIIIDSVGLVFNALGIDMLWHGVEVNHAVYSLLLQDVTLALFSSMMSLIINWPLWYYEEFWFKLYGFFALISLIFQDWCWAAVAYLRLSHIFQLISLLKIHLKVPLFI